MPINTNSFTIRRKLFDEGTRGFGFRDSAIFILVTWIPFHHILADLMMHNVFFDCYRKQSLALSMPESLRNSMACFAGVKRSTSGENRSGS